MIAVVQRVRSAEVVVDQQRVGSIAEGLLVLLGVANGDTKVEAEYLAGRIARLRAFPDREGIPNLALTDTGGEVLVVSQFTLCADTRKGNRPSFVPAAPPQEAEALYEHLVTQLKSLLSPERVATGRFGAMMDVSLVNAGPYTIILERSP